jgi:hypothetical protein
MTVIAKIDEWGDATLHRIVDGSALVLLTPFAV